MRRAIAVRLPIGQMGSNRTGNTEPIESPCALAAGVSGHLNARVLKEVSERAGDDQRSYGAGTMRSLFVAPQPSRPLDDDLELRRSNRIRYTGTGVWGLVGDKGLFAALNCSPAQRHASNRIRAGFTRVWRRRGLIARWKRI